VIDTRVVMVATTAVIATARDGSRVAAIVTEIVIVALVAANIAAINRRRKRAVTVILSSNSRGLIVSRAIINTPTAVALSNRAVNSSLSKPPRNLVRKRRGLKALLRRSKARLSRVRTKANVENVASAVNAAVVAAVDAVVVVAAAVVTMPVVAAALPRVAKARTMAHRVKAPVAHLANHTAMIQVRTLLRADPSHSNTPSLANITRANPPPLHPRRSLASLKLTTHSLAVVAARSSPCGARLRAPAAVPGVAVADRAVETINLLLRF